jgi:hypothetical protein
VSNDTFKVVIERFNQVGEPAARISVLIQEQELATSVDVAGLVQSRIAELLRSLGMAAA